MYKSLLPYFINGTLSELISTKEHPSLQSSLFPTRHSLHIYPLQNPSLKDVYPNPPPHPLRSNNNSSILSRRPHKVSTRIPEWWLGTGKTLSLSPCPPFRNEEWTSNSVGSYSVLPTTVAPELNVPEEKIISVAGDFLSTRIINLSIV